MFDNIKGAIFDLDGTLIDSMWVWSKIDHDYLGSRGINIPNDLIDHISHLSFNDTAKYFKKRFNIPDSIETILSEWNSMALNEYTNNVFLKKGVYDFLLYLKKSGIKIGLATSNSNSLLQIVLKNNNIYEYFDAITTTDEVSRGKNFPDVYLLTAKKLDVKPEDCVVFEDILPAIMGAKAAGMKVVGVYDSASFHQKNEILKTADKFIYEYTELITTI